MQAAGVLVDGKWDASKRKDVPPPGPEERAGHARACRLLQSQGRPAYLNEQGELCVRDSETPSPAAASAIAPKPAESPPESRETMTDEELEARIAKLERERAEIEAKIAANDKRLAEMAARGET